jgi:hypothetical protein
MLSGLLAAIFDEAVSNHKECDQAKVDKLKIPITITIHFNAKIDFKRIKSLQV